MSTEKRNDYELLELALPAPAEPSQPMFCGMPLKYVSLVTLAVQNALLAIIMHYSRVSRPSSEAYSAAAAVLVNELLKGSISLAIAFARVDSSPDSAHSANAGAPWSPRRFFRRCSRLGKEVFSPDCWKLSIPAILYVIQNNLQYVAASNLQAATFQVTYQMKILTTAFFSVLLLRKRLSATKWFALFLLAVGVAMVQIPSGSAKALHADNNMQPLKGFVAVAAACFTSGLAGVYFEMVLKNSPGDLWVRNVQLSLFSLLPALGPLLLSGDLHGGAHGLDIFRNFGPWAWGTVAVQVFGGLVTALVIKHADNILKGFATSLSILISSLASVALFNFTLSFAFVAGSSVVLAATMLYSRPEGGAWTAGGRWRFGPCRAERPAPSRLPSSVALASSAVRSSVCSSANNSCPGTPVEEMSGHAFPDAYEEKDASVGRHLRAVATTLGETILAPSRPHSQVPSRAHTPTPGVRTSPSMPFLSATWQSTAFGASPPS